MVMDDGVQDMKQARIGWCVSSLDARVASVRYRALLPMVALEAIGCRSVVFTAGASPRLRELDALVFVKNFSLECANLAQQARALGKPVILDLCDNIFIEDYGKGRSIKPGDFFLSMAARADAIVVTTEALADVVRGKVGGVPVLVVPDGMDDEASQRHGEHALALARRRAENPPLRDRLELYLQRQDAFQPRVLALAARSLWRRLRGNRGQDETPSPSGNKKKPAGRTGNSKRIVESRAPEGRFTAERPARLLWFGSHGAPHAQFGMLDLLAIREDIEAIAEEFPAELIIVSNNREKYEKHICDFEITTRYEEWSPEVVARWLAKSHVVLIPNSLDEFSICKSANRAIHALAAGVPVVATPTPAMRAFAGCVALDGFREGIRGYLRDAEIAKAHVAKARNLIVQEFGPQKIAGGWIGALNKAEAHRHQQSDAKSLDLVIALNLIQDLDLALPLIRKARERGLALEVWCSIALLRKSPRVARELATCDLQPIPIVTESIASSGFPRNTKALLTITETSLGPHKFTNRLTRLAKAAGVRTATMQHGLENVALTYSDEVHPVSGIEILADRIYLWGGLDTLHPDVSPATRARCISMGCTKPAVVPAADGAGCLLPDGKRVVGVFENLHWHRYSDEYRTFFLDGIASLADAFPETCFLVKPHHAGMWLTSRFTGERPGQSNIVIADPADPRWEPYTAGELLGHMDAVITTPSTVALDAARRSLPVAVVAHDLSLDRYNPLPQIRDQADWHAFVAAAIAGENGQDFQARASAFVDSAIKSGDAAALILDDLKK
ncbi:MAG: glycosyltransferase [Thermomonas sp.]|uniref:glycosyltransferase n=1 Tax=Thermomonas sp. TaxID=1971895 RepID=UPI0039E394DC